MRTVRIWVVGFGTVGRWVVRALHIRAETLTARYGFVPVVVAVANARDGFVHRPEGLDLPALLDLAARERPLTEHPGARHLPSALEGLRATEADLLVEVTASPGADGEPGFAHMRAALDRRIPVVTSNKWPVALHGMELVELARRQGVAFRAESTVMSGTPVLSTLVDGLAGTTPIALRGILNATANFVLSAMTSGQSYEDALGEAQAVGLAERDPSADVDGHDAMAKTMILAALVFGRQLRPEEVARRGIVEITRAELDEAAGAGARIKLVASLEPSADGLEARVEPVRLAADDPLASIQGVDQCGDLPRGAGGRGHDRRPGRGPGAGGPRRLQRRHRGGERRAPHRRSPIMRQLSRSSEGVAVNRLVEILEEKGGGVLEIDADASVLDAVQLMVEKNVGSLLVTVSGEITGIVTERDYLRRVTLEGRTDAETRVGEIMSSPLVVVTPDTSIDECMAVMTDRRIRHLPVVEDGRVVGLVSIGDLVKFKSKQQTFEIQYLTNYITA